MKYENLVKKVRESDGSEVIQMKQYGIPWLLIRSTDKSQYSTVAFRFPKDESTWEDFYLDVWRYYSGELEYATYTFRSTGEMGRFLDNKDYHLIEVNPLKLNDEDNKYVLYGLVEKSYHSFTGGGYNTREECISAIKKEYSEALKNDRPSLLYSILELIIAKDIVLTHRENTKVTFSRGDKDLDVLVERKTDSICLTLRYTLLYNQFNTLPVLIKSLNEIIESFERSYTEVYHSHLRERG